MGIISEAIIHGSTDVCTGAAELLDVWLEEPIPVEEFAGSLASVFPARLGVGQVRRVGLKEPAMQTQTVSAEY